MFRTGKAVLMATVAMSAGAPLAAQEVFDLDPIRVEAEEAQATLGNRVIGTEQIEERNPATMADVFNGESAIITSGGASIAQKIMVQGIEESLLSVTIDGARQNKSAFHHTGNVLLDPSLLKAVEVSEGLAPADAGPGALGGALAYTTKDARDLLEPGQEALVPTKVLSPDLQTSRAFLVGTARRECLTPGCSHGGIRVEAVDTPFVTFTGDNGEAFTSFTSTSGFDGCVKRKKISLIGNILYEVYHRFNFLSRCGKFLCELGSFIRMLYSLCCYFGRFLNLIGNFSD